MIEVGDRVMYNLSSAYAHFWQKTGIVINVVRGPDSKQNLLVLFDEVITCAGAQFDGEREILFGSGCFEIISKAQPDWEV